MERLTIEYPESVLASLNMSPEFPRKRPGWPWR